MLRKGFLSTPYLRRKSNSFSFALIICSFCNLAISSQVIADTASLDLVESPLTISLSQQVNIDANAIIINQYGIYNTTHINQAANSSNLASITQFGESNSVDILQLGIGNSVVLVQSGNESTAEVFQHGDNNVATINQSNGQHFAVQQIGNEMVVNITQYRK